MTQSDWLRELADWELVDLVNELERRAEQFSSTVRMLVNDELRRRKMPLIGTGKSRF